MKLSFASALTTIALAFVAGLLGMWVGHQFMAAPAAGDHSLHAMVHKELRLSPEQDKELHVLETAFAARREALETEMRKANAELAAAIRASETAGPEVEAAVHHFHDAMGALQTETIEHVFAMRKVLTAEQRRQFDDRIAEALTTGVE